MSEVKKITYNTESGYEVALTEDIVRTALTKGNSQISSKEVFLFVKMCEARKLNPFIGEAYLVKYGKADAQLVVSKDYWMKQLKSLPGYEWHEAGILTATKQGDQLVIDRHQGTYYTKSISELVGGWARVRINGHEYYHDVSLAEFGRTQATWNNMPATMIRKVAVAQLAREVAPATFGGLYMEDEIRNVTSKEDKKEVLQALRRQIIANDPSLKEQVEGMTDVEALKALHNSLHYKEAANG